jgi:hypothetical protein
MRHDRFTRLQQQARKIAMCEGACHGRRYGETGGPVNLFNMLIKLTSRNKRFRAPVTGYLP